MKARPLYTRPLALALSLFLAAPRASAIHTLEELWFNSGHTYTYNVNDSGFVCGAYTNTSGVRQGFVVTPDGYRIVVSPYSIGGTTAYTECAITDINNNGVALLHAANATTADAYRGYYNPVAHEFTWVLETGLASPVCNPLGINADSAIAGWYPSTSTMRFAFVMHKTPPAGQPAWQAYRYAETIGSTYYYYATWGTDVSSNYLVGYYLETSGSTSIYKSFRMDLVTHTMEQVGLNNVKIHGISPSGAKVVGEFKVGGVWKAFWADMSAAGTLTMHTLAPLFDASVSTSLARSMNEKGEIGGYYLHPDGIYRGLIYRKDQPGYRLPGFNFSENTYHLRNANGGPQDVWTSAYWGTNQYAFVDPYVPAAGPMPLVPVPGTGLPDWASDSTCPTWLSFMREFVGPDFDQTTDPGRITLYKDHLRPRFIDAWVRVRGEKGHFGGFCFGFSLSALMRRYNAAEAAAGYGIPGTYRPDTVTNGNVEAIRIIERTQFRQLAPGFRKYDMVHTHIVPVWNGLYRLKMTFGADEASCNPRPVGIRMKDNKGAHAIVPYKIHTPQTLPFTGGTAGTRYDTLFLYDSNYPTDTTTYLAVGSYNMFMSHDSVWSSKYDGTGGAWWSTGGLAVESITFNEPGIRGDDVHHDSRFKVTAAPADDSVMVVAMKPALYFEASGAGGNVLALSAAGFSQTGDAVTAVRPLDLRQTVPLYYETDTAYALSASTHNYTDSAMWWNVSNESFSMGIARKALPGEHDNGRFSGRSMAYGTHDAAAKTLSCWYRTAAPDYSVAANIMADGLGVADGDSLHTESLTPYTYTITKITGAATTYDLTAYAVYGTTAAVATAADIPLAAGATHTIDAYFPGPAGPQVAVLIDNGSDGILDDTLFVATVAGVPEGPGAESGFRLYPNPAGDVAYVDATVTKPFNVTLTVVDAVGRTAFQQTIRMRTGYTKIPLLLGGLVPGVYVVRVADDDGQTIYQERLQKQ